MEKIETKNHDLDDNLRGLQTSLKYVKTIFGDVKENKVTFCFDMSGSMYQLFHHFREHLVEKLFQLLFAGKSQKFNVVLFNSSIHQFYSKHLMCTQKNILNVMQWMNRPYYESKSNMLGGLIKSFEDEPDAVYLVTDGFPSNDRQELLSHLLYITKGRPIRSIMITNKQLPDDCALDFLEDVARITNGSLSVINISNYGAVEVIMPLCFDSQTDDLRRSFITSSLNKHTDFTEFRSHFIKSKDCIAGMHSDKILHGDPMTDLPLVVPFISQDPLSGKKCPFYHPFNHWYWPQYWQQNGPGPFCMWAKHDKQYACMLPDFRESRAFISGRKYLESYINPKHSLPYAGMMLINKKVLACNHNDYNHYYLGKVLSQVSPTHFIVKFDINNEFNEAQKTLLEEIIDVDDQKRHSIDINDYVLAPIKSEKDAYQMAIVLEGKEKRDFTKDIIPVKNVKLTVKFLSNNIQKQIEPNQAIYLSMQLRWIIEKCLGKIESNRNSKNFLNQEKDDNNEKEIDTMSMAAQNMNNNCLENDLEKNITKERFCVCRNLEQGCCCINKLHHCISGRVASPVDDGKALTLEQIDKQVQKNLMKEKEKNENKQNEDKYSTDEDEKYEEDLDNKEFTRDYKSSVESDDDIIYDKHNSKDEFTETDLNWCILRLLNKHSKQKPNVNERPPWKYWGHSSIPDVIDPPNSEPYNNPPFWGCLMPKPVAEWPSASFQEVNPHMVSYSSPAKMYDLFKHQVHHPSQRPKRDASVGRDSLPPEEITKRLLERRMHTFQGGYIKGDIKNPYSDSVKPILSSWSSVGSLRNPKNLESCLNSLEKSRIESQIQRDQSNILRYVENKPKSKPAMVRFN